MSCLHCQNPKTNPRNRKTKLGYSTFFCPNCKHSFNERTGSQFNKLQYPSEIVMLVVFWSLRYKLSLRDLTEMFLVRGFEFTHETVRLWESRFAPQITATLKAKSKFQAGKALHVDETYLKINGKQHYLYRALDRFGNLVDVRLTEPKRAATPELEKSGRL